SRAPQPRLDRPRGVLRNRDTVLDDVIADEVEALDENRGVLHQPTGFPDRHTGFLFEPELALEGTSQLLTRYELEQVHLLAVPLLLPLVLELVVLGRDRRSDLVVLFGLRRQEPRDHFFLDRVVAFEAQNVIGDAAQTADRAKSF